MFWLDCDLDPGTTLDALRRTPDVCGLLGDPSNSLVSVPACFAKASSNLVVISSTSICGSSPFAMESSLWQVVTSFGRRSRALRLAYRELSSRSSSTSYCGSSVVYIDPAARLSFILTYSFSSEYAPLSYRILCPLLSHILYRINNNTRLLPRLFYCTSLGSAIICCLLKLRAYCTFALWHSHAELPDGRAGLYEQPSRPQRWQTTINIFLPTMAMVVMDKDSKATS